MIAENAKTAIQGKNVYMWFPTNEEAKEFFDSLHIPNVKLGEMAPNIITYSFNTEQEAKEFHEALVNKFGDRKDPKVRAMLHSTDADYRRVQ